MKSSSTDRLASLDAFRGLTIAGMILVNNPGSWNHVYAPLLHATWHGWTPTDLVFPFFLFIVGVAMTFSLARYRDSPQSRGVGTAAVPAATNTALYRKILRRAAVIFALGLLLALFPKFDFAHLRIVGVLQRIAIVYLVVSLILLRTTKRTQIWITAGLLLGYWALMKWVPVPNVGPGVLTPEGNFASWLDRFLVLGAMHRGTWDPEGLVSTFPAVATTLLGVFTGDWIRSGRERSQIATGMLGAGVVATVLGMAWGAVFPINKNLWTSSYVLFTAGVALIVLAVCYWLIDVRGLPRWAKPAIVFGVNPLAAYVFSSLLANLLRTEFASGNAQSWLYQSFFAGWLSPVNASLAYALCYLGLWWGAMALLYRRNLVIKI